MTTQPADQAASLVDGCGRRITYLRVALTSRCNFRCQYCMPDGELSAVDRVRELSARDLRMMGEVAGALGIRRIRLTGGEPLVRNDLSEVIEAFARAPGIDEVALTTNGLLLGSKARALVAAGLRRVNVSLDTLRPERFREITGLGGLDRVLAGLDVASAAGLSPIKINVVAMRGINDDELVDLARLSLENPWQVRFIELMPVGSSAAGRRLFEERFLSSDAIRARLGTLEPVAHDAYGGPAQMFRLPGALGMVGFITPVSGHFCADCNRLRLTTTGELRPCLFSSGGIDLGPALRQGDRQVVAQLLRQAVIAKPRGHDLRDGATIGATAMANIGG